jgi:hypothetical protein
MDECFNSSGASEKVRRWLLPALKDSALYQDHSPESFFDYAPQGMTCKIELPLDRSRLT